jgi:type IX secretion system PorP/SprF family membrane protein
MFNETFINPAYAGSHESVGLNMLYRNQWVGLEGSPKTQTFSMHSPINKRKMGIGLSIMNESIGVSELFAASANIAYRIKMNRSVLSFGLQGGFVNDVENFTKINTIDPGDHQFTKDVRKYFLPNAGFGAYFYTKNYYAGFSIPRLLENKIDPSLPNEVVNNVGNFSIWHYYLATGYVFTFSEGLKFKPSIMVKAVPNSPIEIDFSTTFLIQDVLWLGASYRTGDAVSGIMGFQLSKQLRIGYSYDYTISDLQKYNSGSHELTLSYNIGLNKSKITSPRYF